MANGPVESGSTSGSASSGSSSGGSKSTSSTISIPQTAAAGSLTITKPPQTATSYFKLAENQLVTFGWNFTDVIVTPTSLTVSAVCENGYTYAVGPNDGIIEGTATQVVWDIYSYQKAHPSIPLVPATYTLTIWDDRGPGATRAAGYMSPNDALTFAIYTPQAYTPLASGWECAGCNDARSLTLSVMSDNVMACVLTTFLVALLSGLHLFRRPHYD
ncbi:hypothetical protein FISHEDRAFT_66136 [Fistulina hepatica ATCC 64428]|uniref:DUF7137 domain-containing protein n=1 Tax=Fistulina hepatica ATCC 64428 TaxID=1128425 RepID=A0A0D7AA97_9AGAR|nr:hypothetical protein FISHEDRAFT_66136 [Fistulina hepatica ATCC 64428]